jgi:hypothetical protein
MCDELISLYRAENGIICVNNIRIVLVHAVPRSRLLCVEDSIMLRSDLMAH